MKAHIQAAPPTGMLMVEGSQCPITPSLLQSCGLRLPSPVGVLACNDEELKALCHARL